MQFRHPEILYFLLLLVIPVLVHLFQLRRFKKSYFTNVRLLQELSIQTRKSSQLKKYLLLATRLLLLAFAVLAFAQPFFPAQDQHDASNELYVVLDNSFSMQAKGEQGPLLQRAIQDILEEMPEQKTFSLLTNDGSFWRTDVPSIRKDLQTLPYSAQPFNAARQIAAINAQHSTHGKDILVITDAVGLESKSLEKASPTNTWFWIPEAQQKRNVAIDSIYLRQALDRFYEIGIKLKAYGSDFEDLPLALYNQGKLIAKTLVKPNNLGAEVILTIPKTDFDGYAAIEDKGLAYDDRFYFSISKPQKTSVMAVGTADANAFLSRIYTPDEFDFTTTELRALDYNKLEQQDAVILNAVAEIPQALQTTLKAFVEKGGNVIVIPAAGAALGSYNALLRVWGNAQWGAWASGEKKISQIHFGHPAYQGVFDKKVENFQYPNTRGNFTLSGNLAPLLSYEDQTPFLASVPQKNGNVYVFAAPLDKASSNLQNAPIVVPTFYNMAQSGLRSGLRWNVIGQAQPLLVDVALGKDELIALADVENPAQKFTPMQQILNNKVRLTFTDHPTQAGNYTLLRNNQPVGHTSFNYARTEGDLSAANPDAASHFKQASSLGSVLHEMTVGRTDSQLWKWFVILALAMLLTELLILKLLK